MDISSGGEKFLRADVALVSRGLAPSRERARAAIIAGFVTKNGRLIKKPGERVLPDEVLAVSGDPVPFVSRGGLKLQKALECYNLRLEGVTALDVGASTGGFTDCMLRHGAARVYALDVGSGQLDPALRADPRVVSMERRNAREMIPAWFDPAPSFASVDVSFISVRLILPPLFTCLSAEAEAVVLVKPQFEAGRGRVNKNGIVKSAEIHRDALASAALCAGELGFRITALDYSPLTGADGNMEFLMLLKKPVAGTAAPPRSADEITEAADAAVRAAHEYYKDRA